VALVPPRPALDSARRLSPGSRFHRQFFNTFDTSGKSPAYCHHRKNSRARAGKPAAGFFNPNFLNRTAAARHGATSSHAPLAEASQAGRRPSLCLNSAGTRERAGTRGVAQVHGRTRPPLRGDRVCARNDRRGDHAAHLLHTGQVADMTASLIALALAGLVAIAVWEALE
jgi:hypothetical protein